MITWFKLHHDLPDDIKLRRFNPQEKWAWVVLLCIASKARIRGVIEADDEDIAEYCEFNTKQDWLYYRDKLIAKGMLEVGPDGNLHILHWEDRQYEKPSDRPVAIRDRVRRYREKKRLEQKAASETPCNALQTPVKRASNATDTDTDLDPDLEVFKNIDIGDRLEISVEMQQMDLIEYQENTNSIDRSDLVTPSQPTSLSSETDSFSTQGSSLDDGSSARSKKTQKKKKFSDEEFEEWWTVNRYKKNKGQARNAFLRINPEKVSLEKLKQSIQEQQDEYMRERVGDPMGFQFFPYPATWLNAEGWENEPTSKQRTSPSTPQPYVAPIDPPPALSMEEKRTAWEAAKAQMPKELLKRTEIR